ncbi:ABC transporter permease [Candidatus Formimonas warabiya]|uniref:ABC transporter permease n=1 Tax=Formimonas warabiya TaxID=1761012 RepID=A0A3G1KM02_FORW1|nr:ABC transporter permease [Candidatus Formimonas warabiya]ATW23450.1 ABC transporter permease [Candidatus Formimonas warabiya]
MNLWESFGLAVESIRANKMRSFLTTLGIVIGITAVIIVMAIGQGGRAMLISEMERFGTNLFAIYVNYEDGEGTRQGDFSDLDIEVIKQLVPEVKYLSPVRYDMMHVRGTRGEQSAEVIGTNGDYDEIRNFDFRWGKYFSRTDEEMGRRATVLDEELAVELFGYGNPVGQRVMLNGNAATVIGVLKKEESVLGWNSSKRAYIPYSMTKSITGWDMIHQLEGSARSKEDVNLAMERAKKILERRHHVPGHYLSYSMEQEMQSANKITGIMTLVVSAIAGISLFVGGIGVMNIMLVSVTERTREIGIRMALGACRRDILGQFLIEAVCICVFGGIMGIILGYGGASLVALFAKWPSLVSGKTILVAFLFSASVGLFFGIYPANKASKLDPIEALRRD